MKRLVVAARRARLRLIGQIFHSKGSKGGIAEMAKMHEAEIIFDQRRQIHAAGFSAGAQAIRRQNAY